MDEGKPAASSTLTKEGRAALRSLFKPMAPLYFIHDFDFRNLVEKQELGIEGSVSGKVDFVLADPFYNVQMNRKDHHAEYDVFCLNNRKDMAKIPKDIMKPAAHGHVYCFAFQGFLLYTILVSE